MSGRPPAWLVVAAVVLLVAVPIGAVSITNTHTATSGVVYQTNSGVAVELADQRQIRPVPFEDDRTWSNGTVTVSGSDASVTLTDTSFDSTPLTVRDLNVQSSGNLTINRSDLNREVTITEGDANTLQVQDFAVDNGSADLAYSSNNGLTVELTGFAAIGIAAVDTGTGEPVDTAVVGNDGVAELQLPSGTRNIRLESTPSELRVFNEAKPSQLVTDNVTLRARLFPGGAESDTVIEREVTNGTVSLAGVPVDEELVITVREQNTDFTYRRILIESAIQTSEIYILPTSEPSAEVRFQLRDDTGRFDGSETRLFVEKPINKDFDADGTNETRYQVISGDRVGADAEFPTILIDSNRYRIRVENDQGEQRVLGAYVVQGAQITTLPIGEVQFTEDIEEGAALQTDVREAPDSANYSHELRLVYLDPSGSTDEIEISVTNQTGATVRPTSTEDINGSTSAFVETFPLNSFDPETDTLTVDVTATQGFETEQFTQTVGALAEVAFPIDPQVLELIGLVSIIGVAGLLVIVRPAAAALVTPGWAGALSLIGVVSIPIAGVVLAGVVGVLAAAGSRGR